MSKKKKVTKKRASRFIWGPKDVVITKPKQK